MKILTNIFVPIRVFSLFIIFATSVYSQSVETTKQFIVETITNNPPKNYTLNAKFYEESGGSVLFYQMVVTEINSAKWGYSFDVKGINYIREGKSFTEKGTPMPKIIIVIKNGYYISEIFDGKSKKPDSISIYLSSADELQRLKKALIHLCKLYGGSPNAEELFKN